MPARQVRQGRAQMAASVTEDASEGMDPALPQRTFLKRKQPSPPAKDVSEKAFSENSLFRNVLWDGRRHGPAAGDGEGRRRRGSSGAARGGWHGDAWAGAAGATRAAEARTAANEKGAPAEADAPLGGSYGLAGPPGGRTAKLAAGRPDGQAGGRAPRSGPARTPSPTRGPSTPRGRR